MVTGMVEAIPCPWCKVTPHIIQVSELRYIVICPICNVFRRIPSETAPLPRRKAIRAWNKRDLVHSKDDKWEDSEDAMDMW